MHAAAIEGIGNYRIAVSTPSPEGRGTRALDAGFVRRTAAIGRKSS